MVSVESPKCHQFTMSILKASLEKRVVFKIKFLETLPYFLVLCSGVLCALWLSVKKSGGPGCVWWGLVHGCREKASGRGGVGGDGLVVGCSPKSQLSVEKLCFVMELAKSI